MDVILFLIVTVGAWALVGGVAGTGVLQCAFVPLALGLTYISVSLLMGGGLAFAQGDSGYGGRRRHPDRLRVTHIGESYVEFEHPHGGSWSYGMGEDLAAVRGVERVEALGGWRYRAHLTRNPTNAARVLEAAHEFRTTPRELTNGVIELNERPGYDTLYREAEGWLD